MSDTHHHYTQPATTTPDSLYPLRHQPTTTTAATTTATTTTTATEYWEEVILFPHCSHTVNDGMHFTRTHDMVPLPLDNVGNSNININNNNNNINNFAPNNMNISLVCPNPTPLLAAPTESRCCRSQGLELGSRYACETTETWRTLGPWLKSRFGDRRRGFHLCQIICGLQAIRLGGFIAFFQPIRTTALYCLSRSTDAVRSTVPSEPRLVFPVSASDPLYFYGGLAAGAPRLPRAAGGKRTPLLSPFGTYGTAPDLYPHRLSSLENMAGIPCQAQSNSNPTTWSDTTGQVRSAANHNSYRLVGSSHLASPSTEAIPRKCGSRRLPPDPSPELVPESGARGVLSPPKVQFKTSKPRKPAMPNLFARPASLPPSFQLPPFRWH